jgi:DNA repair exonuclease SbcCD ATPase subunit
MAEALSPEEQIASLRLEAAQYRAVIAELTTERDASRSELAEAAVCEARLITALLEIEHMKMQLAALRRERYGQSSEKLDREIAQLEMRLEDLEENLGEQIAATPSCPNRRRTPSPSRAGSPPDASRCRLTCRAKWCCMSRRSPAAAAAAIPRTWPSSVRP